MGIETTLDAVRQATTKSQDALWIIDSNAVTIFANTAMAEILGSEVSTLIGRQSFDFLFAEDIPAAQKLFDAKAKGGRAPFHFRLKREDDSPIWVDVQATPMHNPDGQFIGIVGTFKASAVQCDVPDES